MCPGKAPALRAGFLAATGDVIVMIDADGSMSAEEIPHFLWYLEHGFDLVKGSAICLGWWVERYHGLAPGGQSGVARDGQCPLPRPTDRPLLRVLCLSPLLAGEPRSQGHRFRDRDRDDHPRLASGPPRHRSAQLRAAPAKRAIRVANVPRRLAGSADASSSTVGPSENPSPPLLPSCRLHPSACSASDGGGRGTPASRCEPECR